MLASLVVARPALGKCRLCSLVPAQHVRQLRCLRARRESASARELAEMAKEKELDSAPTATSLEWDSPLSPSSILKYPHPRLRAANATIGVFDESLKKLSQELLEVMYQDDGVGLAAPQVGVNLRLMVFNPDGVRGKGQEFVFVNPTLLSSSSKVDCMEEGCLSFPDIRADVMRPVKITIKAQDVNGKTGKYKMEGFSARVFQHEFDHLQGVLFHDRFDAAALERTKARLVSLEEKFLSANPGLEIRRIG